MSKHPRLPAGTKAWHVQYGPGVVLRSLKRIPSVYVAWGTQDLVLARSLEAQGVIDVELVRLDNQSVGFNRGEN